MTRIVYDGGEVKALDEPGKVGGYLVRFSTEQDPDLTGDFFTAKTYFGPSDGDGADLMFHHGLPLKAELAGLADHIFRNPIKTRKDEIGIFAEAVLDMSDKYEAAIYKLAKEGKLGWSSGTAKYLIRKEDTGEIKRWPIVEGSLTPTPAEPRNKAGAIKALEELADDASEAIEAAKTERDLERALRDAGLSRKTAELSISRMKAILSGGSPEELAELKRELDEVRAQKFALSLELLRAQLNQPKG